MSVCGWKFHCLPPVVSGTTDAGLSPSLISHWGRGEVGGEGAVEGLSHWGSRTILVVISDCQTSLDIIKVATACHSVHRAVKHLRH